MFMFLKNKRTKIYCRQKHIIWKETSMCVILKPAFSQHQWLGSAAAPFGVSFMNYKLCCCSVSPCGEGERLALMPSHPIRRFSSLIPSRNLKPLSEAAKWSAKLLNSPSGGGAGSASIMVHKVAWPLHWSFHSLIAEEASWCLLTHWQLLTIQVITSPWAWSVASSNLVNLVPLTHLPSYKSYHTCHLCNWCVTLGIWDIFL